LFRLYFKLLGTKVFNLYQIFAKLDLEDPKPISIFHTRFRNFDTIFEIPLHISLEIALPTFKINYTLDGLDMG
jgi:replication initiation and membrane attachment protein DnaB